MRRTVLVAAAIVAAALATGLSGCGGGHRDAPGSTLTGTLTGSRGSLVPGPGEPLAPRTELAPGGPVVRTLTSFVQLSDLHVTDEESPLRAEQADRIGGSVASSFRPQESLSAQVLAAAVESANALHPGWAIVSGDIVDSDQANELGWAIRVLDGGLVTPDSGRPGYDGVQAKANADPFLYRPDIDAPRHPGLLADAQEPFRSPGLRMPWLPLVSNHDVLVQGVVRPDPALTRVATGNRKLREPSRAALDVVRSARASGRAIDTLLEGDRLGTYGAIAPDAGRRPLGNGTVAVLARAAKVETRAGLLTYDRSVAPGVAMIALDTADRAGGAGGVLPASELAWLAGALVRHRGEHLVVVSPTPLEETRGGGGALALLDRTPGIVAVLAGDTHRNRIRARRTSSGGYWLVRSASLADYPQQFRAYRLQELAGGRVALDTWVVDQAGDSRATGFRRLAGISRDLAYLDTQGGRSQGYAGTRADRNARLFLP